MVEESTLTDGKPDAAKMKPICYAPCAHVYRIYDLHSIMSDFSSMAYYGIMISIMIIWAKFMSLYLGMILCIKPFGKDILIHGLIITGLIWKAMARCAKNYMRPYY